MSYLIVRIKPTTIDKVVSLMNKLEKYDIVESVESYNDNRDMNTGICKCGYMAAYPICTKCGRTFPNHQAE